MSCSRSHERREKSDEARGANSAAATLAPGRIDARYDPSMPRLEPGTVVSDRYRVEEMLGEGGMGVVYRAEHVHMRKSFAIKVLLPEVQQEVISRGLAA